MDGDGLMNWKKVFAVPSGVLAVVVMAGLAQGQSPVYSPEDDTVILLESGQLPDYDVLRFRKGEESRLAFQYLSTVPVRSDDGLTSPVVFADVDPGSPYAELTLPELVDLALEGNFGLINSDRNVRIARSNTRSSEADFIPFLDLVADYRYSEDRNENATRAPGPGDGDATGPIGTTRETRNYRSSVGAEGGVNLRSGGRITANTGVDRSDTRVNDASGTLSNDRSYNSNAEVRLLQPLLRGAGPGVATADLRRSRLQEMNQVISNRLSERDVVLRVVNTYFQILQAARQLEVSREAIKVRLAFLEETTVRYEVGRVDESEILRAEINYLNELNTAIDRRRRLDDLREQMLLLLGLPLDMPISFIDVTDELASRGRVDIPGSAESIEEALNNRMELMQSDISVALGEIDRTVSRNDLLPDLNLDGGYNRNDSSDTFRNVGGFENSGWDAGASLRIPLPNIQRREAYRRALLRLQQQQTNRLSEERNITQEVLSRRRDVLTTEAQLTILSKSVEQARKSLELINGRFEVGFATVTEVRLAQDDLFDAETRYSATLLNYQNTIAQLYVALGRPLM